MKNNKNVNKRIHQNCDFCDRNYANFYKADDVSATVSFELDKLEIV